MRVLEIKEKEVCLDGTEIKEFLLDGTVDEAFIKAFGQLGRLDYFGNFPRPFYRITRDGQFIIKGVEGFATFQVIFLRDVTVLEAELSAFIQSCQPAS